MKTTIKFFLLSLFLCLLCFIPDQGTPFIFVLGVAIGLTWGGINLFFIQQIMHTLLIHPNRLKRYFFLLIKFPILYTAGYALLWLERWPPLSLLCGLLLLSFGTIVWGLRKATLRQAE